MNNPKLSIMVPSYNQGYLLKITMGSILKQSFTDYELIINSNCSTDDTEEVVKSFHDDRIKYFKNQVNLGYGKNLQVCFKKVRGDIIFLMGSDDILLKDALLKTYNAFNLSDDIGVVTRPYYWFYEDVTIPVRVVRPYNDRKDSVVSVFDGKKAINKIFESAGQLSGLAYRRKYMDVDFHEEIFPSHIYPLASILRTRKAVFLKDYTVAVRISSSMTRYNSKIYELSPTESWVRMFKNIYGGDEYKAVRDNGIKFISKNFVGLVQIKNFSSIKILLREILVLAKYNWRNLFDIRFWFFSLGTIIVPRRILFFLVDNVKKRLISRCLKNISIELD